MGTTSTPGPSKTSARTPKPATTAKKLKKAAAATKPSTSASPATAKSVAPDAAGSSNVLPVALKVDFTLITPDKLRKIAFGLEKDSDGVNTTWTIDFTLFERDNSVDQFGDAVVTLHVIVNPAVNAKAESAAKNGLTDSQAAHATGPAADAAKQMQQGTLAPAVANKIIQRTLS